MKLSTFEYNGLDRVGIVFDKDRLADATIAYAACLHNRGETKAYKLADVLVPPSMLEIIEGGESSLKALLETEQALKSLPQMKGPRGERIIYSMNEVTLKAPVPRPGKILAIAINNKQGFERAIKPPGEPHPLYFIKLNTCVTGPYDFIEIPDIGIVGSEIEVAAIIGKKGKNISIEKVDEHIFGYTVHNDITAFEIRQKQEWIIVVRPGGEQEKLTYPGRYKCYDTFAPMGPWVVTRDEIGNIENRKMEARINGKTCQIGSTSDMVFKFPQLISYLSGAHTLEPGDIISGGTVARDPIDLRRVGGILESEVEGIGTLKNPIKPI
jgi:2-keto-4-pentenoate hydratase/2-oxohepta-3-ene-1,7-dioic acid hydratase in catechol pathway